MKTIAPTLADKSAQTAAYRMAGVLAAGGAAHFVIPKFFDAMIPPSLPGSPRAYTTWSGVVELATAATLVAPRTRQVGGLIAAAVFIGVFPANIYMTVVEARKPKVPMYQKVLVAARLPLQIPLVTQSLVAARIR